MVLQRLAYNTADRSYTGLGLTDFPANVSGL